MQRNIGQAYPQISVELTRKLQRHFRIGNGGGRWISRKGCKNARVSQNGKQ